MANIFSKIPNELSAEITDVLLAQDGLRIERILSKGHTAPSDGWFDQSEYEWVMVLRGSGIIAFEDGLVSTLSPGDHLVIPPHSKHRVIWTEPSETTVWLAVFWPDNPSEKPV